jgi:flagellar hook-associated protein 1 FlgK
MSLLSTLQIGRTGLSVASAGVSVVGHNVANASTEGFTRRRLEVGTSDPVLRKGLYFGQGARTQGITRVTDRLVEERLVKATGQRSRSGAAFDTLSALEGVAFDETSGTATNDDLREFFDKLQALSRDPSDPSLRREALSVALRLTDGLNDTAQAMTRTIDDVVEELQGTLADIQAKVDQIAALNDKMVSGGPQGAADYADQRDQLITEVADKIGVQVDYSPDGQATLFIGGHALVSGGAARQLDVSLTGAGLPVVTMSADSGVINVTSMLGGRWGGLNDAVTVTASAQAELDSFTNDFATAFNTQHQAGFDTTGAAGIPFFTFSVPGEAASITVDPSIIANEGLFALAGAATAAAGDGDNLTALVGLEDQAIIAGLTLTPNAGLAQVYSTIGRGISSVELEAKGYDAVVSDLTELRNSVSGVDLDQEATELLAWQAAYQASSRVITTANALLGDLMDMVR